MIVVSDAGARRLVNDDDYGYAAVHGGFLPVRGLYARFPGVDWPPGHEASWVLSSRIDGITLYIAGPAQQIYGRDWFRYQPEAGE